MPRLVMLVLAMILSQGWQWSRLLQEQHRITAEQGLVMAAAFTALFLLQQWLLHVKQPVERALIRDRSAVVEVFLKQMIRDYYEMLAENLGRGVQKPAVRVSVMLPVIDRLGLRKRLQIVYRYCPEGLQYGVEEQDLYWEAKSGVIGWVWSRGMPQVHSESYPDAHGIARVPNRRRLCSLAHLRSAICVPILLSGEPIAVMTLDSDEDLDRTFFHSERARDLVSAYAAKLPSQCCASGVKAR